MLACFWSTIEEQMKWATKYCLLDSKLFSFQLDHVYLALYSYSMKRMKMREATPPYIHYFQNGSSQVIFGHSSSAHNVTTNIAWIFFSWRMKIRVSFLCCPSEQNLRHTFCYCWTALRSADTRGLVPAISRRNKSHRVTWPFLLQNLVAETNFEWLCFGFVFFCLCFIGIRVFKDCPWCLG